MEAVRTSNLPIREGFAPLAVTSHPPLQAAEERVKGILGEVGSWMRFDKGNAR